MAKRSEHDDDFTEAERRALADIRREIDAEFGPLEPAAPLAVDAGPGAHPPGSRRGRRPRSRGGPRTAVLLLLGALIGGTVGGLTGSITTLLWVYSGDDRAARPPVPAVDRGAPRREAPAAPQRQSLPGAANLEAALNAWLEATKVGDIETQMRFYPASVPVYYTWRDVTREAVRAEKVRVFGAATRLDISTDTPAVELIDGGAGAVSRFRKRYVIEGPRVRRRGEVLQELRWAQTPDGWRIVAERDAEVLAPSASVGTGAAKRGGTIEPAR